MSPTIRRKYKYFHFIVQTAEDRRQKFHFCRLPFDMFDETSCLICQMSTGRTWELRANSSARTFP